MRKKHTSQIIWMVFTHRKDIPEMNFHTKSKQVYLVLFIGYVRDIPRFFQLNEFFFSIEHNMLIIYFSDVFHKAVILSNCSQLQYD